MKPETRNWLLDRFRDLRVVVVGDLVLDAYVECAPRTLRGEGAMPGVARRTETFMPGAAANAAANAAALGARVSLVGAVGRDDTGDQLLRLLRDRGVDVRPVLCADSASTHRQTRIVASGRHVVRVDEGATRLPAGALRDAAATAVARADVLLVRDGDLGALDDRLVAALGLLAPLPAVVVDAMRPDRYRRLAPAVVVATLEEARAVGGEDDDVGRLAQRVRRRTRAGAVAITLTGGAAYVLDGDEPGALLPARPAPCRSDVGAGDTLAAAVALAIGSGAAARQALMVGMEASAVAAVRPYTSVATAAGLARAMASDLPDPARRPRDEGGAAAVAPRADDGAHRVLRLAGRPPGA